MSEIKVGDWTLTAEGVSLIEAQYRDGCMLREMLADRAARCVESFGIDPTTDSVARDIAEEIVLHGTPVDEAIAKLQKHLEGDAMKLEIGMSVWTKTQLGEPIECKIFGFKDGELLLDSPAYGYVIRRHESEINLE